MSEAEITQDAVKCLCAHIWAQHEKPPDGTPWDICSFPCLVCDCTEFEAERNQ